MYKNHGGSADASALPFSLKRLGARASHARIGLSGLALLLSACSHVAVPVCPAIVPYSAEDQAKAADELDSLPPGAVLPRFMADYGVLRAKLRECAK